MVDVTVEFFHLHTQVHIPTGDEQAEQAIADMADAVGETVAEREDKDLGERVTINASQGPSSLRTIEALHDAARRLGERAHRGAIVECESAGELTEFYAIGPSEATRYAAWQGHIAGLRDVAIEGEFTFPAGVDLDELDGEFGNVDSMIEDKLLPALGDRVTIVSAFGGTGRELRIRPADETASFTREQVADVQEALALFAQQALSGSATFTVDGYTQTFTCGVSAPESLPSGWITP
jgi:hypothetical protein